MTVTAVALLLLTVPSAAVPQDPAASVRWYDVRALLAPELPPPPGVDLRPHLAAAFLNALVPDTFDVPLEEPTRLDREGLDDLLNALLGQLPDQPGFDLEGRNGILRIEAGEAVHAEVRRLLGDLGRLALETVDVEVLRVPAADVAGGLLARAEPGAPLPESATLVVRRRIPLGRATALSHAGVESVPYDYDVEVAQAALAIDPQVTVLHTGLELAVSARASVDGRLIVRAWGREGTLAGPAREVAIPTFAGATLILPSVLTRVFTTSAVLASGEALAVGRGVDGDRYVVRVHRSGGDQLAGAARSPFLASGELSAMAMRARRYEPAPASPSGGVAPTDVDLPSWLEECSALLEPEELFDGLLGVQEQRDLGGRMQRVGEYVYVPDEGPLREALRAELGALAAALGAETFSIEVRHGVLPAAEAVTTDLAALAGRLRGDFVGAARTGDALTITAGRESFYLQDFDVEIAQAASIPDPVVSTYFHGASLWCVPLRAPDGQVVLALDLALQDAVSEPRAFGVADWDPTPTVELDVNPLPIGEFKLQSALELVATKPVRVRATVQAEDGAWTRVDTRSVGGGEVVVVLARVTGRR